MTVPHPSAPDPRDLTTELEHHGLIAGHAEDLKFEVPAHRFGRRAARPPWHYRVSQEGKPLFHLVVGLGLGSLHERARAFAAAFPALACRPLFLRTTAEGLDFLGLEHFEGETLDDAVAAGRCDAERWLTTVRNLHHTLRRNDRPSTEAERHEELDRLVDQVCGLPSVTTVDRTLLRGLVRPAIASGASTPATLGWSNGDFIGSNILVSSDGAEIRLVDYEFAGTTHFIDDDWSRLFHFSVLPPSVDALEPKATQAPWRRAYFWLKQLALVHPAAVDEQRSHLAEVVDELLAAAAEATAESSTGGRSHLIELAAERRRQFQVDRARLDEQLRTSRTELSAERENAAASERSRRELHDDWEARGRWAQGLDAELQRARSQLSTYETELDRASTHIHRLDAALAAAEKTWREAEVALSAATTRMASLQAGLSTSEQERRRLETEFTASEQERKRLETEMSALERRRSALEVEVEEVRRLRANAAKLFTEELARSRRQTLRLYHLTQAVNVRSASHLHEAGPLAGLEAAWNEALGNFQREQSYLRESLAMRTRTPANLLKDLRHALNLAAEWVFGRWAPSLRRQRLRRIEWDLASSPGAITSVRSGLVTLSGTVRDSDGRPPREVYADYAGARLIGRIQSGDAALGATFHLDLPVRRGLHRVRLGARFDFGGEVILAYRCLWGRRQRPSPATIAATPPAPENYRVPAAESIALCSDPHPVVSIVIPIYNQVGYTLRCLDAIARHTADCTYEVIVVDDCSPDREVQNLHAVPHLRVARNDRNSGFVRSCNHGAALARGDYVVLLNNDTEVQPGWLSALLETFRVHPRAGLVGVKLVYPDGSLQEAGGICWQDGSAWNYGRNQNADLPAFNYVRETDYCSGACIILPTGLWRELEGFDLRYAPAYYEDTDLAFRVRAAGYVVYYQPKARVVHYEGKSNGTDTSSGIKAYQVRNQALFFDRWRETLRTHQPNGVRVFRARERSESRKVVLVIDHYVPWPDKDAGSRNMMSYVRFFLHEGYSVKFIGDNHFPHQPYTDNLERMGVEVLVGQDFMENWERWLADHGADIDYVFLSRAHISRRWIAPLRAHTQAPLLFYGHDLISRTLRRAHEQLGEAKYLEDSRTVEALENEVFAQVDWIYYPSADEVAFLREQNPGMNIGRLPLLAFEAPDRSVRGFRDRSGLLFVGGFGHHPNVDAIDWFASEVWPVLRVAEPGLTLTVVGSRPTPEITLLTGDSITVRADVSDAELAELYRSHRVAIAPLRYGGGIKGKILEAMFAGTPMVTTTIGAEGLPFPDEHLVVADGDRFASAVLGLYRSASRWQEVQETAWRFLAEEYSPAALRRALAPAMPELAAQPDGSQTTDPILRPPAAATIRPDKP